MKLKLKHARFSKPLLVHELDVNRCEGMPWTTLRFSRSWEILPCGWSLSRCRPIRRWKKLNSSGHVLDFADCKTIDHCNFGNNWVKGRLLGKFIQLYFRFNEWPDCWQGFDICCTIENSGDLLKIGGIYWNSCFNSWDKIVWNWNKIGNLLHFNNAKTSLLLLYLTEKHCKFERAKL